MSSQINPPLILEAIVKGIKRCHKHSWQLMRVRLLYDWNTNPGVINYWLGEEMIIEICVNCKRVKNK